MWEYMRIATTIGQYSPPEFMEMINYIALSGWVIIHYWEHEGLNDNFKFRVVMKRKL